MRLTILILLTIFIININVIAEISQDTFSLLLSISDSESVDYYLNNHQLHFPFNEIKIKTNLNVFEYYLFNLDKASVILNNTGLSNVRIVRNNEWYNFKNDSGLSAKFKLVSDSDIKFYYGEGEYKNIFGAKGILRLNYVYDNKNNIVTNNVDIFIDINNRVLYWMTKIFNSYVMNIVYKFAEEYIETAQEFFDLQSKNKEEIIND